MTPTPKTITKSSSYSRAAMYYVVLWGSLALASSFVAVDLNRRGITESQWGIISALRSVVVFLVTPMVTRFADRHQARVKVLQAVLILNGLAMLLYLLPQGYTGFLIVSAVVYLFGAGMMPLGDSIIVRMAHRHDIEYGRLRLWGSIGYLIFGLLGGVLWNRIGFTYLYWVGSLITLVVAVTAARLEEPLPNEEPVTQSLTDQPAKTKTIFQIIFSDMVLLLFLVAALLRASGELMFFTFSGIYIDQLTDQAFFTGLINGGAAIPEIPVMMNVQRWIKRFGMETVILVGFIIQAMGLAIFAFSFNPWIMFVGAALRNVGFALYFIAGVQYIDARANADEASTYQGLLSTFSWGLAPLLISPLAGWVYQSQGGQAVFILATIFSILAALVMVPIMLRSRKEKKQLSLEG